MTTSQSRWVLTASYKALDGKRRVIVSVASRPVLLLLDGDKVRALDNRCPHMGFPLDKGTVNEGILTCHWHHARFDTESGCAFDLFADDVPAYDVKVEDGQIFVAEHPRNPPGIAYARPPVNHGTPI